MPRASRTSRPHRGRTRFSCKATPWRRIACGRWMACAGARPANWRKSWGRPRVESDREARRMNLRRIAEAQERALVPQQSAVMAAFARGVNYFIETHRNRLPLEFTLLRYDPRPWACGIACWPASRCTAPSPIVGAASCSSKRCSQTGERAKVEFPVPRAHRTRAATGFERLGAGGIAHCQRQAHPRERSASGVLHSLAVVLGAFEGARPERDRRDHHRTAGCDHRPQRSHRLGRHQFAIRRPGSLPRASGRDRAGGAGRHSREERQRHSDRHSESRRTGRFFSPTAGAAVCAALDRGSARRLNVSLSGSSIGRTTGPSSAPPSSTSEAPGRTSSTLIPTGTSAIRRQACCRFARPALARRR